MNVLLLALQEAPVEEINFGMLIVRMLIFLGLVILLIWVFLRKVLPMISQMPSLRNRNVKILERLPLDGKRSLIVVEVQERVYLLGSAEGQINVLMELDREKMNRGLQVTPGPVSFDSVFKRMFSRSRPSEPPKN